MNDDKCCPKFDPTPWDNKIFEWKYKKFIKDKVFTIFYIPLNFGSVMKRVMRKIDSADAKCIDFMGLSDHTSKWNIDVYIAVDKEIPNAKNVTISGKFLSKVYEGSFNETGKWSEDFEAYAKSQKVEITKQYMWYTTCPKCAKKYGKNHVVIFGEIKNI